MDIHTSIGEQQLERKRNRTLQGKPSLAVRRQLIRLIDKVLGKLQQELVTIEGLKAEGISILSTLVYHSPCSRLRH